jgi:demethylmenaquinone methyltransferase/2-methoxy-6-polyprenyl-1,4-benzoquinol methylase
MRSEEKAENTAVAPHPRLEPYYENEGGRRRFVRDIFDETAPDYERIIRLMSFGSGDWYRRDALRRAGLRAGQHVLDVAVGTGPVAAAARSLVGPQGSVTGLDPSYGMLRETHARLPIPLVQGIAERLPFADASFDFLSMGYALRHVADLQGTFREYRRVLKPGATVLILDFRRPSTAIGRAFVSVYLGRVVPLVARLAARSDKADLLMQYCWDTVAKCVPPGTIVAAMEAGGFRSIATETWFGMFGEYKATAA